MAKKIERNLFSGPRVPILMLRVLRVTILILCVAPRAGNAQAAGDTSLVGLWAAKKRFGPDLRGRLIVQRRGDSWRAEIAGRDADAHAAGESLAVQLPGGAFTGHFDHGRTVLTGHWIQPATMTSGSRFATPLVLTPCGPGCFAGDVVPLDDAFTFYLRVTPRPDGTLAAFLRNPERNLGRFIRADRIERDSGGVRILAADKKLVLSGVIHGDVMTLFLDDRGGSYDFTRVPADSFSDFYPRGRPGPRYTYQAPRAGDDGWKVGTLEQVGISRAKISTVMQALADAANDSANAYRLHGFAIARHGKLVLEEYFFGEYDDKPHDTRSGSKTVLSVLIGAAMQAGLPVDPSMPVYASMGDSSVTDPRKRALTLEHLLNMASGLDCDDNAPEPQPPGSEDVLTQQDTNPDWYRLILDLKMVRDPGAQAVYCSINPHLAGGVVAHATRRSLPDLVWTLVGRPLQMRHYYVPLAPLGAAYMGGGMRLRLRDYLKLAQLYLNGGTWNGRRIVSAEWVRRSTQPRYPMGPTSRYGYLWWIGEYPYGGRTLHYYFAAGNGGQISLAIPDLDLAVAAFGGNYADRSVPTTTRELIPKHVLPSVER
jgi:CubicO group peptidase (beta-lactamase class C family)